MSHPLPDGVDLKFKRARKHLDEFATAATKYLASEPFKLSEREDPATGDLLTVISSASQPPVELSVVLGDVVHNTRSALDQLAWHLVKRDGGTPGSFTYFPTGETKSKFLKRVKEALAGASETTKAKACELAVHPGGDDELWLLRVLDIEDKHRVLVPVGMAYGAFNIHTTFVGFNNDGPFEMPPIALKPADAMFPLKVGDEIFRFNSAAREADTGGFSFKHSFRMDMTLSGVSPGIAGRPVLEVLTNLVDHAERQALSLLEP